MTRLPGPKLDARTAAGDRAAARDPTAVRDRAAARDRAPARALIRRAAGLALAAAVILGASPPSLRPVPDSGSPAGIALANSALPPITVYLDRLTVDFDVPPVISGDRALVPFRFLAEALGCTVHWSEADRRVTAVDTYNGRTVILFADRVEAFVDGQVHLLDVPARIIDGRTLIPLRFFSEALGALVEWHEATRTITVVSPRRPMTVLGYYALGGRDDSSWAELFGAPYPAVASGGTDVVSEIACSWFVLDPATGRLILDDDYYRQTRPASWQDVLRQASEHGLRAEMMVFKANADGDLDRFLADPAAMARAVEEILAYAVDFAGVNLDLEYLGRRQAGEELALTRQRFTGFVRLLGDALHSRGKTLTLSLHPLNSWFPGYDWAALGEIADRIVIMAYNYTTLKGPEPLDKVIEAVDLALAVVPGEKLLLGLLMGRDGTYETPESLVAKIGLAKRRRLAGIAVWRLGVVGPERLEVIRRAVSRPPAP
ncbi:MAG: stalk domain-containing protein [Bacillota bacterium]